MTNTEEKIYLHKKASGNKIENIISAVATLIILLLIIICSTRIHAFDLDAFGNTVSRFFSITLNPEKAVFPNSEYSSESAKSRASQLSASAEKKLFSTPDIINGERPLIHDISLTPPPLKITPQTHIYDNSEVQSEIMKNSRDILEETSIYNDMTAIKLAASDTAVFETPSLIKIYDSGRESAGGPGVPGSGFSKMPFEPPADKPDFKTDRDTEYPVGIVNRKQVERSNLRIRPESLEKNIFPALDNDLDVEFKTYTEKGNKTRFFELTARLKENSTIPASEKDVIFLIDISRSISRKELGSVKQAVLKYLAAIPDTTRWNIAIFSEETVFYSPKFKTKEDFNKENDIVNNFIKKREGARYTNVFDATQNVLANLTEDIRPCNVFLISDSEVTQGTDDVKKIVQGFDRIDRKRFSIFTFNAGPGGNRYLLELLAYRSRGFHEECPDEKLAEQNLSSLALRFDEPVLTNVVINYSNLKADELYPKVLPHLYRNNPITIYGRAKSGENVTIRLVGFNNGAPREFFFKTKMPKGSDDVPEIAKAWAQGKAHALMAILSQNPKDNEMREQIVQLAEHYNLESTLQLVQRKSLLSPIKNAIKNITD